MTTRILEYQSQMNNCLYSFIKCLYEGLSEANKAKMIWAAEQTDLANRSVWGEVLECIGPSGNIRKPWVVQVNVYSRVSDDVYGHNRRFLVDGIKGAMNVVSSPIYHYGSTDISRATPSDTGYVFYPRINDEGTLPEVGDGIEGYYIRYWCHSYRADMVGA